MHNNKLLIFFSIIIVLPLLSFATSISIITPQNNSILNSNFINFNVSFSGINNLTVSLYNQTSLFNSIYPTTGWCNQEYSNVSSCNSEGNGLYYSSNWSNISFGYDGDWNTSTLLDETCTPDPCGGHGQPECICPDNAILIINYTTPSLFEANIEPIWQVKDSRRNPFNITLPSECYYNKLLISLKITEYDAHIGITPWSIYYSCLNQATGLYTQLNTTSWTDAIYFYEESIWWNILNVSSGNTFANTFKNIPTNIYYINVTAQNDTANFTNGTNTVILNTLPVAVNVSITNAPLETTDDAVLGCDCLDNDSWQTNIKNYTWFVNGTQVNLNLSTLGKGNYSLNSDIIGSCSCWDSYQLSNWVNTSTITIGDTTPPNNLTSMTLTKTSLCSSDTSRASIIISDSVSPISTVYIELSTPGGIVSNYSMSCGTGLAVQCDFDMTGYAETITVNKIYFSDTSTNWGYTNITQNIYFQTCGGGGGGGVVTKSFDLLPKALTPDGEKPEPGRLVGNTIKTYTVKKKIGGTLNLKLRFVNSTTQADGKSVDATLFFKTFPERELVVYQETANFTVSCNIPDEYRYNPWGIFNTTLVVEGSYKEQVNIVCESNEHAGQAGALTLFLNQEILPNLTVGTFIAILVLSAFLIAWVT